MNATRLRSLVIGVGAIALTPFAYGQIPIDESVGVVPIEEPAEEAATASSEVNGQFYIQMQRLQNEVQMLRGLIEEQSEEIRRLEQQRFDDFMGVDQRLAALETGAVGSATVDGSSQATETASAAATSTTVVATGGSSIDEAKAAYDTAYGLLRQRDFAGAKARFSDFLSAFPESDLAANAYYWLGEIALADRELEVARERFNSVVNFFPDHRKAQDALYKLGTVYYMLEQYEESRAFYTRAAEGTGQAATLAQRALEQNF
ncbi:tetratricopeptide repeat protein [Umboniibacter marinipuniceus]|uniref:Cell division coordinator CpoB n=1 Tax=Umboniibacter marinipuniceus TaxID=569599 RepID=A0A3M0A6U0_9GAMM|nr:tetratricopeptide repeat protein [Umboniibacter marinipuniceus]RMA79249.1 tol-pal system protein YbgF [Umboniibacter marinipuniceus]